jgi:hypothetical protein
MTRDRRSSSLDPSSLKIYASLAFIGAVFVVLAVAGIFDAVIVIDSGTDGPPVDAIGNVDPKGPINMVCSLIEFDELPDGTIVLFTGGRTSVTSPGGSPDSGEFRYSIHSLGRDGGVGSPIVGGALPVPTNVASFPGTTDVILPASQLTPLPVGPGSNWYWWCFSTNQRINHIPVWFRQGRSIRVWVEGGFWQEFQSRDLDYLLRFEAQFPSTPTPPPVTPTPGPEIHFRFLPQAGAGPGAGGSEFDTAVSVFSDDGNMNLEFRIQERSSGRWQTLDTTTIFEGETREDRLSLPIFKEFGPNGAFGAVRVNATSRSIAKSGHFSTSPMVQAVIFATLPDGRQFGQFFAGEPPENAQQAGEESLLFTTHDPSRYRVNVGVAAVVDGTRVVMTPLGNGGVALADPVVFELDDGGSDQVNDIHSRWGLGMTADVMVLVEVETGAAFPYGSVLDGRTGVPGTSDPTTILPVTEGSRRVVLLEMGRITGLNEFSGSASIYNHGALPVTVRADFYERGVPGVAETSTFQLGARTVMSWDDVVGELTGRTGVVGAVVFNTVGQTVRAVLSAIGREFAIFTEGAQVVGTAGQLMPGLSDDEMLQPGESFHFIGLRDRSTSQGRERSHLGVLNLGEALVTMTVFGFDASGASEGSIQQTVQPGEQLRVNNILRAINPDQDGGLKRVRVEASGALHVLAYRVNGNGDPVTLRGFRTP